MADWEDVRRLALALPDTDEQTSHGHLAWRVHGKMFVLDRIGLGELEELIVEAWLSRAPKRVAREYAAAHGLGVGDGD